MGDERGVVMGVALWLVVTGAQNPAAGAAAGVTAVLAASEAISTAGSTFSMLIGEIGPVSNYFLFLDSARKATATNGAPRPAQSLAVVDVAYRYSNADQAALTGVDLEVRRGEAIALVGVNGVGKTTLVNTLLGILQPTQGNVLIDQHPLAGLSEVERLATFSLLTQEFGRYELAVRQAVELGTARNDVRDDEIWRALEFARAAEFVRTMPQGLETQLGQQWGGVGLSGGQWQRLALARIALRGAPVWLLDEPTSAVDAETEAQIFDDLSRTKADRITVVVSHRAWTLRNMDRIYVVDAGRIVQVGSYAELMHQPGRFREIFLQQDLDSTGTDLSGAEEQVA